MSSSPYKTTYHEYKNYQQDNYQYDNPYKYDSMTHHQTFTQPSTYSVDYKYQTSSKNHDFLNYSTPYDLGSREHVKKAGALPEKVTYIEKETYPSYEISRSQTSPYDFRSYRPLESYDPSIPPKVIYERVTTFQDDIYKESPKKAHFHEYSSPEIELSNKVLYKLDEMKDYISDLKQKVTYSPINNQKKPEIFYYEQPKIEYRHLEPPQEIRASTPINEYKAEHIKKSGLKASSLKSSRVRFATNSSYSPLKQSGKIFSPMIKHVESDIDEVLHPVTTPKTFREITKKSSPKKYESLTLKYFSNERVVPSRNPIYENESETGRINIRKAKTIDIINLGLNKESENKVLCIDCDQYIIVGNANLHSLFCFKSIENKNEQRSSSTIRSRIQNIIFFLEDEIIRIKNKYGSLEKNFLDNCYDLKNCLNEILECKKEMEIRSLINKLHYINLEFDKFGANGAEIKRLGIKAEDDLNS